MQILKKNHKHESQGLIKYFYYCVPDVIYEKVKEYLFEKDIHCAGIITYTEDLIIEIKSIKLSSFSEEPRDYIGITNSGYKKLFLEQQLEIARLGAMRVVGLKEKINKLKSNNIEELNNILKEEEICG